MNDETLQLLDLAVAGDNKALETLLAGVQVMVYNLALRMLGSPHDAEDATQEVLIRVMTKLASFKKECAFTTWVYRIAANHLLNYRKGLFSQLPPLSFEYYAEDIQNGFIQGDVQLRRGADEAMLASELKQSCTNVMLQCFCPEERIVYILGTMFKVESRLGGEILGISPEAYRKRLSRLRERMAGFLSSYCGLGNGSCSCKKRVDYAIMTHRLNPENLEYSGLTPMNQALSTPYTEAMEQLDELSGVFEALPSYQSPHQVKAFITKLLSSDSVQTICTQSALK
jgi:RNA polymerase sigma factor (sigma-70 family)